MWLFDFFECYWIDLVNGSTEIFVDVESEPYSWIELRKCQWVDPPTLWEAVSGEGWIQKWSLFQLQWLFSPRPGAKTIGKKAKWQPPIYCILPSDWPERFVYSIQVKPYATDWPEVYGWIAIRVFNWESTMYFGNPNSFSPHLPNIPHLH